MVFSPTRRPRESRSSSWRDAPHSAALGSRYPSRRRLKNHSNSRRPISSQFTHESPPACRRTPLLLSKSLALSIIGSGLLLSCVAVHVVGALAMYDHDGALPAPCASLLCLRGDVLSRKAVSAKRRLYWCTHRIIPVPLGGVSMLGVRVTAS
ncbi:hypothetical protein NDU88_004806 [Pleurodeles waltl]|uniref:Uncharacterized protein n=1 Tax=Pleurodeles waltl TaxID=8319 RepID=A0AAV7RMB5_PLEWA|nr:hypothetical protein NDU88_004806 [Pleurodeles waltl]